MTKKLIRESERLWKRLARLAARDDARDPWLEDPRHRRVAVLRERAYRRRWRRVRAYGARRSAR